MMVVVVVKLLGIAKKGINIQVTASDFWTLPSSVSLSLHPSSVSVINVRRPIYYNVFNPRGPGKIVVPD